MEIIIIHESDGMFSLYINDQFYGKYDSPVQAAKAVEEMDMEGKK